VCDVRDGCSGAFLPCALGRVLLRNCVWCLHPHDGCLFVNRACVAHLFVLFGALCVCVWRSSFLACSCMLTVLHAHGQRQLLNQLWRSSNRVARNVSLSPRVEKDSPNRMRISLSVPVAAWSAATVFV
jgi:hypothetical protein